MVNFHEPNLYELYSEWKLLPFGSLGFKYSVLVKDKTAVLVFVLIFAPYSYMIMDLETQ